MQNFQSLFAAYMLVWAIFFVYEITVARRVARLQDELDQLKDQIRRG
jgi:CcmD family protein